MTDPFDKAPDPAAADPPAVPDSDPDDNPLCTFGTYGKFEGVITGTTGSTASAELILVS